MFSFAEYASTKPNAWSDVESKILGFVVDRYGKHMMKPERVGRMKVLDLAAGTGRISQYLIDRGVSPGNITAVDIRSDFLNDDRFPAGVKKINSDARNLGRLLEPGETFNLVTANMFFHLLSTADSLEVFRQVRKVLAAEDSYFLAVVPHPLRAALTTTQLYETEGIVLSETSPWGEQVALHHRTVLDYKKLLFDAGLESYNMATAWRGSKKPDNYKFLDDSRIWNSVVDAKSEARQHRNLRLWFLSFWDWRKDFDESRIPFCRREKDYVWP